MTDSPSDISASRNCGSCGELIQQSDNFCRRCGKGLKKVSSNRRGGLLIASVATTAVLVGVTTYGTSLIQRAHGSGVKPQANAHTNPHDKTREGGVPGVSEAALGQNPALAQLLERARSAPKDADAWRAVGGALLEVIAASPSSTEIQFDALDVFSYLLSISPDDPLALRALGDLCFEQRLFDKSLSYYERYLKLNPTDNEVRSRRASTLTFIGRADEAVAELSQVVKEQPDTFQPLAYLSIALSQKGDIAQAKTVGEQALAKAPSAEARERFLGFLSGLSESKKVTGSEVSKEDIKGKEERLSSEPAWVVSLRDTIKQNPIAGPKFNELSISSDLKNITLSFSNFPMEGMPPFARAKFIGSMTAHIPSGSTETLTFLDKESGRIMHTEHISSAAQ